MLGIIGAMEVETATLCSMLENAEERVISGITFTQGTLYNKPVVISQCSEGKVNSAIAAQTAATISCLFSIGALIAGTDGALLTLFCGFSIILHTALTIMVIKTRQIRPKKTVPIPIIQTNALDIISSFPRIEMFLKHPLVSWELPLPAIIPFIK